ncbi:GNAT family N-acetyltransferase [Endozoicomonas sp. SM1973]|uniref:GNAT family N-acetyltransferase n=1 Tax=Spartinivicinus marinus TaxID=2994442 RepID=A0A853HXD6_9GAMM|nr:GNAT family N-acetyltransferase [Spartinivicinus marinus]MCX4029455.1 GNAT family N-acetyltransferase [Spartinivicinus marinus]NYZ65029.1 GNAT family N-acetyltransferase [Spartinivicinus marinus]
MTEYALQLNVEDQLTRIVYIDENFSREARSMLYHAYLEEPSIRYLMDDSKPNYAQRVRALIRELIKVHFAENQPVIGVMRGERLAGFAFVSTPDHQVELFESLRWRWRLMLSVGLQAAERFINYRKEVAALLADKRFYRVPLVGINPKWQHQGYGRLLMEAVDSLCETDQDSEGVVLDTGNSRYLSFYSSLGYQELGKVTVGSVAETVLFRPNQEPQLDET